MTARTDLLVIGAGPYAYAAAAYAGDRGIDTTVVGLPMAFWRHQMPADMYLRSGPDWYLDANREYTFEAFFEDRGLVPADDNPIPIGRFLEHTEWFAEKKGLVPDPRRVADLTRPDGRFVARLEDGTVIEADKVLAAPGVGYFAQLPDWYAEVPGERRSHTSELVAFDDLADARVAIIGGRQSAYEWAALLCDHGAARVDVVHRHPTPAFAEVSWAFVDAYVEQTLTHRGWWRHLSETERAVVAQRFWQVGRLTLEPWLVPRLRPEVVQSHPGCAVVEVAASSSGAVVLSLSDATALEVDHVVFASGYRADLTRVPYLAGLRDRIVQSDGFPDLSEGFETSVAGLFVIGFAATRDFGPFYGFTKGCPSAATIVVEEMLR
jgi:FAD-dependent urate hydroxylase